MKIFDTLRNAKTELEFSDKVRIYLCGVTVYDDAHIGHARTIIVFDVLHRFLESQNISVEFIQNFTDVDDKIIDRAQQEKTSPLELAAKYTKNYFDDFDGLNVKRATKYPKATEHIEDMQNLISELVDKKYAYVTKNGVYFSVSKFTEYGKLSKKKIDDLVSGARVEIDEEKNNPIDFALWKFSESEPSWDSPWGKGRPGWHIECSAMSLKYLGDGFEIHGGGRDLIFPHHENEIAQSESSTSKQFAKIWMHVGMITINGEKMAKSIGNVKSVNHVLEDWGPNVIRLFCLSGHYSKPIDYTKDLLKENLIKWRRLEICYYELRLLSTNAFGDMSPWAERVERKINPRNANRDGLISQENYREICIKFENEMAELESNITDSAQKFDAALENDFNTPLALTELFSMIKTINGLVDEQKIPKNIASLAMSVLEHMLDVLGLNINKMDDISIEGVLELLQTRNLDRNRGNYEGADKTRDFTVKNYEIQLFDHKNRTTTWVKREKIKADTS